MQEVIIASEIKHHVTIFRFQLPYQEQSARRGKTMRALNREGTNDSTVISISFLDSSNKASVLGHCSFSCSRKCPNTDHATVSVSKHFAEVETRVLSCWNYTQCHKISRTMSEPCPPANHGHSALEQLIPDWPSQALKYLLTKTRRWSPKSIFTTSSGVGAAVAARLDCSPPTKVNWVQSPTGTLRIFSRGYRARRCRWPAGFLGALPFTLPPHSGDAPYSPHSTLIGSRDIDVKTRPNLFTHSPQWCLQAYKFAVERGGTVKLYTRIREDLGTNPGFPCFPEINPGECCEGSLLKAVHDKGHLAGLLGVDRHGDSNVPHTAPLLDGGSVHNVESLVGQSSSVCSRSKSLRDIRGNSSNTEDDVTGDSAANHLA
ncbi:hypothetical protein PR048_010306 [Dryococelus australis]|uniref:Uncharacterized protein n=1 Tax=Dryococelus australis TaxID=614101 RepID=A0ABQ9I2U0_9NEOP|nr:hypothetical protein PR048_010306 [Dryococelus australis]